MGKRCSKLTGLHANHARESLFGVFKAAIPVVQDSDAVPELGLLSKGVGDERRKRVCRAESSRKTHMRVRHVVQRLLIRAVRLLQVVDHEEAMACGSGFVQLGALAARDKLRPTESTPDVAALWSDADDATKVFSCLLELFSRAVDGGDLGQGDDRVGVVPKGRLVSGDGAIILGDGFGGLACRVYVGSAESDSLAAPRVRARSAEGGEGRTGRTDLQPRRFGFLAEFDERVDSWVVSHRVGRMVALLAHGEDLQDRGPLLRRSAGHGQRWWRWVVAVPGAAERARGRGSGHSQPAQPRIACPLVDVDRNVRDCGGRDRPAPFRSTRETPLTA